MNNSEIHLQAQLAHDMEDALELGQLRSQLNLRGTAARLEALAEWSDACEITKNSPRGGSLRIAAEVLRSLDARTPLPDFWKFSPRAVNTAAEILRFNRDCGPYACPADTPIYVAGRIVGWVEHFPLPDPQPAASI